MNYQELGNQILELVGGKENVAGLNHCATRLRFNLRDASKAQTDILKGTAGVLGVVMNGGQYQIIIGNDVNHVYKPIAKACNLESGEKGNMPGEKKGIGARFIDTITGIFTPILPAITAAGMLKAVLALLVAFKWIDTSENTYQVISFMADAAFYFLPILLANSAAKKFNCNPYLAMMLGGILLHPNFVNMVAEAKETGQAIRLFFIPVYNAGYASSVIPIILAVWFMSYVEPVADKISPKAVKFFTKPLLTILVTGAVTLWILGPIGYVIAGWIADGVNLLNTYVSWLVPLVLGGVFPLLVMTGTHYGIIPIGINNRLTTGYDTIVYPANLGSNLAQGAATFAVGIKTKSREIRTLANSAGITAVCGITEPALYGINMRYKTPLISACIGGAAGGLYMGLLRVKNYAGGSPGLLTLPGYIGGDGFTDLIHACIGGVIAVIVSFILSYVLYKDKLEDGVEAAGGVSGAEGEAAIRAAVDSGNYERKKEKTGENVQKTGGRMEEEGRKAAHVFSPVKGHLIPISQVKDPTFAEEIMGEGAAVMPEDSVFVSPVNGVVQMVSDTRHAIGFVSEEGAEVLMHVGLDTVSLNGKHFEVFVKAGDKVKVGTPVLKADLNAIKKAGYDTVTPVIITNSADYTEIRKKEEGTVKKSESIMEAVL